MMLFSRFQCLTGIYEMQLRNKTLATIQYIVFLWLKRVHTHSGCLQAHMINMACCVSAFLTLIDQLVSTVPAREEYKSVNKVGSLFLWGVNRALLSCPIS